jgi:hypothetical protein
MKLVPLSLLGVGHPIYVGSVCTDQIIVRCDCRATRDIVAMSISGIFGGSRTAEGKTLRNENASSITRMLIKTEIHRTDRYFIMMLVPTKSRAVPHGDGPAPCRDGPFQNSTCARRVSPCSSVGPSPTTGLRARDHLFDL